MANKRVQHWCTTLFISLWILATVSGYTANNFSGDVAKTTELNVLGVTSNTITFKIPCLLQETCSGKLLTLKKIGGLNEIDEPLKQPTITIRNLQSKTVYVIQTVIVINGTEIKKEKIFRTCPDDIPKISSIRIAKAGPGWLDLRWPPVRDLTCQSNIFYIVQYGANSTTNELIFSPEKKYGIMRRANGDLIFRPTHPCATWDKEFCLLLTDYVKPGKNHTVKVKPVRFRRESASDGLEPANDTSKEYVTFAYADPTVMGPYILGQADANRPCNSLKNTFDSGELIQVPDTKAPDEGRGLSQQPITVGVWIIVLAVLLPLCALALLLVAWRCRKNRSKLDQRASEMYDDTGPTINPQSINNHTTTTHQDLVPAELHKVLKGIHPKNTGTGGTMEVEPADKEETINNPSASNYYMTMNPQPVYDDAQHLVKSFHENPYSNIPRDSNLYMEPSSPLYEEAKFVVARESKVSEGYNEVYSHRPEKPWRSQF